MAERENTVVEEEECPLLLLKSIGNIIKNEGYMDYKLNKRIMPTDGSNYMAKLYEFDVKGVTNDGYKETNIFAKYIINVEQMKDLLSIQQVYLTELYIYKELFDIYETLQNDANIPPEDRYKIVKSYNESDPNAIILQNMVKIGYKTWNRMDVVTLKLAELSIEQLAKFHALSFVLQKKDQEYFDENVKSLKVPLFFNEHWKKTAANIADISIGALNGELKTKAMPFKQIFIDKMRSYMQDTTLSRCCLCHGDFRANNILFKEKVRLILF